MFLKGLIESVSLLMIFTIVPVQLYSHRAKNMGCHYNGTWYADKSIVLTTEKCLNCQCSENTLVCRLKVCPEMPIPPPRGCVLVQKKSTCCPYLSCANFDNIYKVPITRRIIAYLDQYERESIDRVINDNILQGRSDDNEVDLYVCVKNGTVYKSGSAMSSSNLCSYCYCIGGTEKCVRPKCMLPVSGCKPIFVDSTCCPVRYDCSSKSTGKSSHEMRYRKTSNKHYLRTSQRLQRNRGCTVNHNYYPEGHKMKSDPDKPCTICFCIRGQRKCAPKKCSPALRNCIPVIPKGQCCPSSYDCGYYGRASNSRQFNLFSLLFGKEDEQNFNDTDLSMEYQSDRIPIDSKPSATTERSILDAIRKGLEFIDNNTDNIETDMNVIPLSTTLKALSVNEDFYTSTEINFVNSAESNMNLSNALTNHKSFNVSNTGSRDNVTSEASLSLLGEKISVQSTTILPNDGEKLNYENQDNSTGSIFTTTFSDGLIDDLNNVTAIDDLISVTTDSSTTADSTTDNLSETTMFSTIINDMEVTQTIDLLNDTSQKIKQLLNSTALNAENQKDTITVLNSIKNELSSIKPEKKADFLDVLLNGLSDIFGGDKIATNMSTFTPTELYDKLSTQKPSMPPFKPLPTQQDGVPVRINSKIANLTFHMQTNVTKGTQNAHNTTKSKPTLIILPESPETFTPMSTSTIKNFNTSDKIPFVFDVISAPIKMNPTILDAESFEDIYKPTLPPSLPNLKIIPFLPTDAVKGDHHHHKFYHQNPTVNARIDYNLYDDGNIYPSITEKYPLYNNLDDDSKAEYIYKFNVEGPDALLSDYQTNGGGISGDQPSKGFSPPTKTEGGFIPKEPLLLDNKAILSTDNIDVINGNVKDNYHIKPLLIDITTAYVINTSKIIEIITPNPFRDVIKTEPPPNLTLLIEDKKNNLLLTPSPIPAPPALAAITAEKSYILPTIIEVNLTNTQPTDKKHIIPDKLETQIGLVINVQPTPILTNVTQNYSITEEAAEDDEEEQGNNEMMEKISSVPIKIHNIPMDTKSLNESITNANNANKIFKASQVMAMNNTSTENNMERRPMPTSNTTSVAPSMTFQATKRLTHKTNANKMTRVTTKTKAANKSSKTKNSLTIITTPMASTSTSASTIASVSLSTITMRPIPNVTRRIVNLKPAKTNRNRTVPLIKKQTLSGLMTMQLPSSTSRVTTNTNLEIYTKQNRPKQNVTYLSEQSPFYNGPPSLVGNSVKIAMENSSKKFDNLNTNHNVPTISTERPLNQASKIENSYDVISPKPFLAPTASVITTQRIEQHHYTSSPNIIDPAGILKLAGCNIYGRMYRVGRIIIELSNPCLECRCTEIGVKCNPLAC